MSENRPELNESSLLLIIFKQTSQVADLFAAEKALNMVHRLIINEHHFSHVILKTNSDYLARNMTESIWKWLDNGFRNHEGRPVENGPIFKLLHERLLLLERVHHVKVSFCKVSKEDKMSASLLAKVATLKREDSSYSSF